MPFSLHLLTRLAHLCLVPRLVAVVVSGGSVGRGGVVGPGGGGRFGAGAARVAALAAAVAAPCCDA